LTIGGSGASTGTITIGRSTAAQSINIANGAVSTSIVNIGSTGASTGTITIGRSTGAQTISIGSGALGSTVQGGKIRTINIGITSATTGVSNVNIGKYSDTYNHTTTIEGRYVTINAADTITLASAGALVIQQNLAQATTIVGDLEFLTGVATGSRAFVTDATAPVFGSIVVDGGGTGTPVPVYYDGTDWRVG
jgi:hypothetical protein